MHEIRHHIDPFGAADIAIVCDERDPDAGGASHHYVARTVGGTVAEVHFQHGPRGEGGKLTGCTNEVLLAIVIDRLEGLQTGPFACEANDRMLNHVRDALDISRSRAAERKARGVLGQNKA